MRTSPSSLKIHPSCISTPMPVSRSTRLTNSHTKVCTYLVPFAVAARPLRYRHGVNKIITNEKTIRVIRKEDGSDATKPDCDTRPLTLLDRGNVKFGSLVSFSVWKVWDRCRILELQGISNSKSRQMIRGALVFSVSDSLHQVSFPSDRSERSSIDPAGRRSRFDMPN
jgi:hypothetical protein